MRSAMRGAWRAIRGSYMPWPGVLAVIFGLYLGLEFVIDGHVRFGIAAAVAIGGTLGTMARRKWQAERRTDNAR